ncbi:MAG: antibiotic biosynthesis monooxygenase family protein [Bacteroidota bacterium]
MSNVIQHKYGLQAKLRSKKGKSEQLSSILLRASELLSEAKGCVIYLVSINQSDENDVRVIEVWETQEDHDDSLKDPKVKALIGMAIPLLDGMVNERIELNIIGGKGII